MVTVSCVLRSGGEYGPQHVERLAGQAGVQLTCLTDLPPPPSMDGWVKAKPLHRKWPGWWSKIEALRQRGPVLQMDLDVTIKGDLEPLLDAARAHEFIACRCFFGDKLPHVINSSVMAWSGDVSWIADEFEKRPQWIMRNYTTRAMWGDQAFIRDCLKAKGIQPVFWQDILSGMVLSHKCDVKAGADTSDMRICVHHGKPRPWDLE